MNSLQRWLASFAVTVAATAIAFVWLDRPIASFVHDHVLRQHQAMFAKLTHIPEPLVPLAMIAFVVHGTGRPVRPGAVRAGKPLSSSPRPAWSWPRRSRTG